MEWVSLVSLFKKLKNKPSKLEVLPKQFTDRGEDDLYQRLGPQFVRMHPNAIASPNLLNFLVASFHFRTLNSIGQSDWLVVYLTLLKALQKI